MEGAWDTVPMDVRMHSRRFIRGIALAILGLAVFASGYACLGDDPCCSAEHTQSCTCDCHLTAVLTPSAPAHVVIGGTPLLSVAAPALPVSEPADIFRPPPA